MPKPYLPSAVAVVAMSSKSSKVQSISGVAAPVAAQGLGKEHRHGQLLAAQLGRLPLDIEQRLLRGNHVEEVGGAAFVARRGHFKHAAGGRHGGLRLRGGAVQGGQSGGGGLRLVGRRHNSQGFALNQ